MTTFTLAMSDDIRDVVSGARKLTRRPPSDLDIALALLRGNRLFSRLDALLKHMRVRPRDLEQALKAARQQNPRHLETPASVMDQARDMAERDALHQRQPNARRRVEVEHLLMALSRSPATGSLLASFGITELRVEQAVASIQRDNLKRGLSYFVREVVEVVLIVLFFLVVIKEGLGELRLIPSESMVPTLLIDDRVVIEKISHWWQPYQRGDVLVFYPPMTLLKQDPFSIFLRMTGFSGLIYKKEDNIDVAYIKRLIGMPGDVIDVKPGVGVFVNGKQLNEPYVKEIAQTCTTVQPTEICGPVRVPPNTYFMMGDNRNQSADSRFWGPEPENRVIGRAVFRIWPLWRLGTLSH